MATHSNILAWEIPWTKEPGRLQSMGSQSWTPLGTHCGHCLQTEGPSSDGQPARSSIAKSPQRSDTSSKRGSEWEALLFIFPVLNKSARGNPMSGLDVKYCVLGDSVLISRWKRSQIQDSMWFESRQTYTVPSPQPPCFPEQERKMQLKLPIIHRMPQKKISNYFLFPKNQIWRET